MSDPGSSRHRAHDLLRKIDEWADTQNEQDHRGVDRVAMPVRGEQPGDEHAEEDRREATLDRLAEEDRIEAATMRVEAAREAEAEKEGEAE